MNALPNSTNDLQCSEKVNDKRFVARLGWRIVKGRSPISFQNILGRLVSESSFGFVSNFGLGALRLISTF
jgi:hypothetical protein